MARVLPALVLLCLVPTAAVAQVPDWEQVADVDTVEVVTTNEDGTKGDTTVWLVIVDGQGYVRTGSTRWGENVVRDPEIQLRIGDGTYDVLAVFVEDEELRAQIQDAFREKYGFFDRLIGLFRGESLIMRLTSR